LTAFFFCVLLTIAPLQAQDGQAARRHSATVSGGVAAREADSTPGLYNPVADPSSTVTLGNARFTVLTPQMIRMEWAADGKFEDHPSFVFLNRRLPVAKFFE
jgi:alpha-glucosidase